MSEPRTLDEIRDTIGAMPFVQAMRLEIDTAGEDIGVVSMPLHRDVSFDGRAFAGVAVAALVATKDPLSRVRISAPGTLGQIGDATVDVVGIGDDSIAGFRLHVFGNRLSTDGGYELRTVERTIICSRGVTSSGACL